MKALLGESDVRRAIAESVESLAIKYPSFHTYFFGSDTEREELRQMEEGAERGRKPGTPIIPTRF
jgi:hypothetical protein